MARVEHRQFSQSGDKQLWVISNNGRRLPVFAVPFEDQQDQIYFRIDKPFAVNKEQWELMFSAFYEHNIAADGTILVHEHDLPKVATRAKGITPEHPDNYKWNGRESAPEPENYELDSSRSVKSDMIEFLNFAAKDTGILSPGQLKLAWTAICKSAPKWLIDHNRPIEMGLFRIVALPYRLNWKQFLDCWFPEDRSVFKGGRDKIKPHLTHIGFSKAIKSPDLFHMEHKTKAAIWNLEIIANRSWYQESIKLSEAQRHYHGDRYWATVQKKIGDLYDRIIQVYSHWVKKTSAPHGILRKNSKNGATELVLSRANPALPIGGAYSHRVPRKERPWNAAFQVVEDVGSPPPEAMPQVSDIQQATSNLRYSG